MGFCFLGPLPLGFCFVVGRVGFVIGLGRKGLLGGPRLFVILFLRVDGASILSTPKASQKLPIFFFEIGLCQHHI